MTIRTYNSKCFTSCRKCDIYHCKFQMRCDFTISACKLDRIRKIWTNIQIVHTTSNCIYIMATKSQKTYLTEFIVLNLFNLARCEENYVSQFERTYNICISKLLTTYLIYLSKNPTIFNIIRWVARLMGPTTHRPSV